MCVCVLLCVIQSWQWRNEAEAFVEQYFKGYFVIGVQIRTGNGEKDYNRYRPEDEQIVHQVIYIYILFFLLPFLLCVWCLGNGNYINQMTPKKKHKNKIKGSISPQNVL